MINGDQPIELAFSFAEEVGDEVGDNSGEDAAAATAEYESVTDDLGCIYVDVPTAWTARNTVPITMDDGTQVPYIAASTDLEGFNNGFTAPGCSTPSCR